MSDTQQSDEPDVVTQTLDEVTAGFTAKPEPEKNNVAEFTPAQQQHIDPYDEDSLNKWALNTTNDQAALRSEIQNLKADVNKRNDADAQKIIDADIKSAVSKITAQVEGIDPLMAEIYLEKRAQEHEGFKVAWDNRNSNPSGFDGALTAIANELEGKFQRVDPQIAENHRAAQQSQQSNTTSAATEYANPLEEALAKAKTEGERQVIWTNAKNLGY